MLADAKAFSGFSVTDIEEARSFYADTLGLRAEVIEPGMGLMLLHLGEGQDAFVYAKPDHEPATYTMLNFELDDIEAAVDGLAARGVEFERYDEMEQDERGIARGPGPQIAWFKDPAGNVISLLQQQEGG
ncbi:MAG TPA: VOC family protein [Thermoleophilaceae bacterium]|nr:VOC family protein [Thermoleophilaceae bacterium]